MSSVLACLVGLNRRQSIDSLRMLQRHFSAQQAWSSVSNPSTLQPPSIQGVLCNC